MAAKGVIHPDRSRTWAHCHLNYVKEWNKNVPDDMDLIINFFGFRALLNESHHSVQFLLTPGLESRRVMEDEFRVALEGEWTTNVMDPPLQCQNQLSSRRRRNQRAGTLEVGSSFWWRNDESRKWTAQSCCTPALAALFFQHSPSR